MTDRLDAEAAREILRRAAEIEAERRARPQPDFAQEALQEAAAEVGISSEAVQRAVAEHGVGAIPQPVRPRSVLGPVDVRAVALVDLPVDAVQARVTRFLRSQLLTVTRRGGTSTEWGQREDLGAKLRRRFDFGKQVRLDSVDRVVASVGDSGDGRSLVRLEADLELTRRGLRTGAVGAPAVGAPIAAGVLAVLTTEPWLFLAGFPAGAALGSAGLLLSRKVLAAQRDEAQRVIDLFLADLERPR